MLIISKKSGHDARKRVINLQRDLIRQVNLYEGNQDKVKQYLQDFEEMSKSSGIFERKNEKALKWITTFDKERSMRGKEKEETRTKEKEAEETLK